MNKEQNTNIDLKPLCEYLMESYPGKVWHTLIFKSIKLVNANNENKLKSKELKAIFREAAKKSKNNKRQSNHKDYHKQLFSIAKILRWKGGEVEWVIQDLLPQNGIAILSGSPASFKTWSTLHFAICIADGLPVYGHFKTTQANVLIIDEEDGIGLLQQRLKILCASEKANIYFKVMSGFKIDQEEKMHELLGHIKKRKIKVIIIDSLVRIHNGDENSSNDMKKVFEKFRELNTMGVTILINHHHGKGADNGNSDSMRGSSDILAAVDCQMKIKHQNNQLEITQKKNRISQELKPFKVDVKTENNKMMFVYSGDDSKEEFKLRKDKELILEILSTNNAWTSRADIDGQISGRIGENKIGNALANLVKDDEIVCNTEAKGKKMYKINSLEQ